MTFQFLCPQGHLLQGDPSQAGQQCACPTCGTVFIIPAPQGTPAEADPHSQAPGGASYQAVQHPQSGGGFSFAGGSEQAGNPSVSVGQVGPQSEFDFGGGGGGGGDSEAAGAFQGGGRLLHIPCPDCKQPLETPGDMVGQDVLCPYCATQFQLRYKDSEEAKEERIKERERQELKRGQMWFQWAIAATIIVLVGLIAMIAITLQS